MGTCGWSLWAWGRGSPKIQTSVGWFRARGFLGNGCAKVAEQQLRLRHRAGARWRCAAYGDEYQRGLPAAGRAARADAPYSGGVAQGPRSGALGRIEIAGKDGPGGPD